MGARIFLTNIPSDVSGYLLALVNTRNPAAALATATTTVTAGTLSTVGAFTLTAGGTTAKWITRKISTAVTLAGAVSHAMWASEDSSATNAKIAFNLQQYTAGAAAAAFATSSVTTELGTGIARVPWTAGLAGNDGKTDLMTSTAFAVGDRLIIQPGFTGAGANTVAGTVQFDYDGATAGADGDTYIELAENLRIGPDLQIGDGQHPGVPGTTTSFYFDIQKGLNSAVNSGLIASNASAQEVIDECNNTIGTGVVSANSKV